jgi:hypothetical protein
VADRIYELAASTTAHPTAAAAGSLLSIVPAALASGVRPPEIREIGIYSVTGVAAEVGIGYPAALGTGTVTSVAMPALSPFDVAGHTTLATSYATLNPTAPTNFFRRAEIQPVVGGGAVWAWNPGEWMLWAAATINAPVIWQISALAVTYDIYVKVAE